MDNTITDADINHQDGKMNKAKVGGIGSRYGSTFIWVAIVGVILIITSGIVMSATTTSNNNAPAQTITASEGDFLVMNFNLIVGSDTTIGGSAPAGGSVITAEDSDWEGGAATTNFYFYDKNDGSAWDADNDWMGFDLDSDGVYTSAVDFLVDANGVTEGSGETSLDAGTDLFDIATGDNIVADVTTVSVTKVWQDSDANSRYITGKGAETIVAIGDGDIGLELTDLTNAGVTIGGTEHEYDSGEDVYIDSDTNNAVSVGDTRVTKVATYAVGSVVETNNSDIGSATEALTNGKVTGGDGAWTFGTEYYVYDAAAGTVAIGDNRLTAISVETVVLGSPADGDTGTNVEATPGWVKEADSVWAPGEDIFIENVAGKLTYSAAADTTIGGTAPAAGTTIVDAKDDDWTTVKFHDKTDGGAWNNGDDWVGIDADSNDYYLDKITAMTADMSVDGGQIDASTDTTNVKFWLDDGDSTFETGEDTLIGTALTASAYDSGSSGWYISGLSQALAAGTNRIFVSMTLDGDASNGETIRVIIPYSYDTGSDGVFQVDDRGIFLSSRVLGNIANANSMTVDAVAPTFTIQYYSDDGLTSSLGDNPDLKIGTYYIKITSNEALSGTPTISIDAEGSANDVTDAATTLVSGNDYKYARTIASDAGAVGSVLEDISITGTDSPGNTATGVNPTNEAAKAAYTDATVPTATATMASDNANTAYATTGDVITLTIVTDESVGSPTVTIAGNTAVTVGGVGGGDDQHWTATYTTQAGDTEGAIAFTLNFDDLAGNSATEVTVVTSGSAVTFDKTVPTATNATMASDNANTTYATTGDVITLTIVTDESVGSPTVTIAGNTAVTVGGVGGGDDQHWTATYTTQAGDTEGAIAFTLNFDDLAGNSATEVTVVTSGSAVTFDKTVPTATNATMASDNANTTYATTGDVITLTIVTDESVGSPTVTIAGNTAVTVGGVGGGDDQHWTATYTTQAGDTEGAIAFTLNFDDLAGNSATEVTVVTSGSAVTFDKTVPTATTATMASDNANTTYATTGDVITLTIVTDESVGSPTVTIAGNTAVTVGGVGGGDDQHWTATYTTQAGDTEGAIAFTLNFDDLAGNSATEVTAVTSGSAVTFDKTVPTATTATMASDNANTTYATTGDVITLTIVTDESVGSPTVTIAGNTAVTVGGVGGGDDQHWTATYTTQAGDTEGAIAFTLNFDDLAGNSATEVTAVTSGSAVTFDKTVPTATTATMASDNANTTYATTGDVITLTIVTDESVGSPTVTIAGNTAVTVGGVGGGDDQHWTATYTTQAGDTEGAIAFTLNFDDLAGNSATEVTVVTSGSAVTFDKTVPTATNATMASDNANTTYATTGDVITLTIVTDESVGSPTVTIAGNTAVTVGGVGGGDDQHWTATYTTQAGDTEGAIAFTLNFDDLAGNSATEVTAVTSGSAVTFDKTVPTATTATMASDNANTTYATTGDVITLTIVTDESVGSPTVTIAGNTAVTVGGVGGGDDQHWTATYTTQAGDTEGAIAFTLNFDDLAGNSATEVTVVTSGSAVTFDKTVPTATNATMASDNANTAYATTGDVITLTIVTDESVGSPTVTIAGNTAVTVGGGDDQHWTATYTTQAGDTEGAIAFTLNFDDLAGNSATEVTAVTSGSAVTFDKTAPVANAGPDQIDINVGATVTFDGSGSSDAGSSIASYSWDFGDGNSSTGVSPTYAYSTGGRYIVTLTVTDNASNTNTDTMSVTVMTKSYNISLNTGWNLVSTPLIPDDAAIGTVLSDMSNVDKVWTYGADGSGWVSYVPGPGGSLTEITAGKGYWFDMSASETLTVSGSFFAEPPNTPPTYPVYTGWNLIGFHSLSTATAYDYLSNVRGNYASKMYCYKNGVWTTINNADRATDGDSLETGYGYWLYMQQNGTIAP